MKSMYKRFFLWAMALVCCGWASGSDSLRHSPRACWNAVTVDEMVEGYHQYCDTVYWWEKPLVYTGNRNVLFMDSLFAGNALFRGRQLTAATIWGIMEYPAQKQIVCISDFRDCVTGRSDTLLLAAARRLYGQRSPIPEFEDPGGEVPAVWLSGRFRAISQPLRYFSFAVSAYYTEYELDRGRLKGHWSEARFSPYRKHVTRCWQMITSSHWADKLTWEMGLLSYDAGRYCGRDTILKRSCSFDVLVVTARDGTADLVLLNPTELPPQNRKYLDELRRFVRQLPPWSFGLLYCSDGRVFPGRYLKAYRTSDGWYLMDYLERSWKVDKRRRSQD